MEKEIYISVGTVSIFYLLLMGVCFFYIKYPPKEINDFYGYRTPLSMKNQANWDFANRMAAKSLLVGNTIFLVLGTLSIFLLYRKVIHLSTFIVVFIILVFLFLGSAIFYTEKRLRAFHQHQKETIK